MRKFSKEWWETRSKLKFCGRRIDFEWYSSCGYMETGMEIPYHICSECYQENLANGIDAKDFDIHVAELESNAQNEGRRKP